MSESNSSADSEEKHSDAQIALAEIIQTAQDIIEDLEDDVPVNAFESLETVDDSVEALEDALKHTNPDRLPDGFEGDVQTVRTMSRVYRRR